MSVRVATGLTADLPLDETACAFHVIARAAGPKQSPA